MIKHALFSLSLLGACIVCVPAVLFAQTADMCLCPAAEAEAEAETGTEAGTAPAAPAPQTPPVVAEEPQSGGGITYELVNAESWPADMRAKLEKAVQFAVGVFEANTALSSHLLIHYAPEEPDHAFFYKPEEGAAKVYLSGKYDKQVALHEFVHTFGVGVTPQWDKLCANTAGAAIAAYAESIGKTFTCESGGHFMPYGFHYGSRSKADGEQEVHFVKMIEAAVRDMGLDNLFLK